MHLLQRRINRTLLLILLCSFAATSHAQFYAKEVLELKKKKTTSVEKLDSMVVKEYYKYEYTYDVNGNKTAQMVYGWDGILHQWKKGGKCEYTYDAGGKMITCIKYDWDAAMNQWKNNTKYDYAYNSSGNVVSKTWLYFIRNRWSNANRDEYIYDANGNLTTWRFASYESNHKWLSDQKENYDFDGNGNISSGVYYRLGDNGTNFEDQSKFTAAYNAAGNVTSILTYTNSTGVYEKGNKFEFTYNANGNIASRFIYFPIKNEWTTSMQEIYYYSAIR